MYIFDVIYKLPVIQKINLHIIKWKYSISHASEDKPLVELSIFKSSEMIDIKS
jgi:hypothetical protein